jgi:hypothetical protein
MLDGKIMGHSNLSPNAAPFHPFYEEANICVYNEGIPAMMYVSEQDLNEALHNIQDEAIDEAFPPDAQDAAELEAAELFVYMMAELSILEEREERTRTSFASLVKRWEVRRAAGLKGRPRAAIHLVQPVSHSPKPSKCTTLMSFGPAHKISQEKMRAPMPSVTPRTVKRQAPRNAIQQPRKQY